MVDGGTLATNNRLPSRADVTRGHRSGYLKHLYGIGTHCGQCRVPARVEYPVRCDRRVATVKVVNACLPRVTLRGVSASAGSSPQLPAGITSTKITDWRRSDTNQIKSNVMLGLSRTV